MAIIFSTTTLNQEGTLTDGDVTYSVNVMAVNNELIRLNCSIMRAGNYIGNISLEHGRQTTEIGQSENLIPHLTKFQEIMDEVVGKTPETTDAETTSTKK